MQATPVLRAMPGFWRRSAEEFKRQAGIAVRLEGLERPKRPLPMIQFANSESLDRCKVMWDKDIGGYSKASLTYHTGNVPAVDLNKSEPSRQGPSGALQAEGADPPHALFSGSISTELPTNRPDIQRSGFAAWRTRDQGVSLFGRLFHNVDPWSYLALRVKSDGRKYFVNIQTESIVPTDLHQHLLPTLSPGNWEIVTIPFSAFVRTNYGMVVEPQREMLTQKIRSVGIGLTDRVQGPFELRIAEVYATNTPPGRALGRDESGFDKHEEEEEEEVEGGFMSEIEPRRKKGEPEKILI